MGWYGAAHKLLDVFLFIPVAFAGAALPAITKAGQAPDNQRAHLTGQSARVLLILALPIAVGISTLADRILILIYGPAFEPGALCLRILIWTLAFRFLTPLMSSTLIACRRQTTVLWITVKRDGVECRSERMGRFS